MNCSRLAEWVACVVLFVSLAGAQTTSTEILGTVVDATAGVIPNAKVTLLRVSTGERRVTTTSAAGNYSFPLIETGDYRVTVEAAGFQLMEKTGITVELQQRARVDFQLTVGSTSETVHVEANAVALKTEDAAIGQVID